MSLQGMHFVYRSTQKSSAPPLRGSTPLSQPLVLQVRRLLPARHCSLQLLGTLSWLNKRFIMASCTLDGAQATLRCQAERPHLPRHVLKQPSSANQPTRVTSAAEFTIPAHAQGRRDLRCALCARTNCPMFSHHRAEGTVRRHVASAARFRTRAVALPLAIMCLQKKCLGSLQMCKVGCLVFAETFAGVTLVYCT